MHLQPVFGDAEMHGGKVSERIFAQGLCLPSGASLTDEERDRVIAVVKKPFNR
jgi:dTDP-4-amino-4,6-dideoxygalactose transaminase